MGLALKHIDHTLSGAFYNPKTTGTQTHSNSKSLSCLPGERERDDGLMWWPMF